MNGKFDVTGAAKSIFGDIVDYAYCVKPDWSSDFKIPTISANRIEPKDGFPVFVKFKNGKSFELWSSEWGGIKTKTEEDYYYDVNN